MTRISNAKWNKKPLALIKYRKKEEVNSEQNTHAHTQAQLNK